VAFPVVAPELAIMRGFRIVHGLMLWSCLFVHGKEEEALPPRDERKVDEPEIVKAAEVSPPIAMPLLPLLPNRSRS
jgi:hypothetical protein